MIIDGFFIFSKLNRIIWEQQVQWFKSNKYGLYRWKYLKYLNKFFNQLDI
jgi:hypothetical protein